MREKLIADGIWFIVGGKFAFIQYLFFEQGVLDDIRLQHAVQQAHLLRKPQETVDQGQGGPPEEGKGPVMEYHTVEAIAEQGKGRT